MMLVWRSSLALANGWYCNLNIKDKPFRGFKRMGLEFDICQTQLWSQFFSFLSSNWREAISSIQKVAVWCDFRSESVIGPYCFENDYETTVTVNSERYDHMITDFFYLLLKNTTWRICGFNKTVLHAAEFEQIWKTRQETFPGRVISRRDDINWPPRSCDLTPLEFFCGATRKTVFMQINLQLLST